MKARSPLVALLVVSLCLAGLLPPGMIMLGNALTEPSTIISWSITAGGGPGANPTVVGATEIDFRMMWEQDPQVTVDVTYYILNTQTGTRILRDQAAHSIGGETQSSIAVDVAGDTAKEIIAASPANTLKCMYRNGQAVWTKTYGAYDMVGCPSLYDLDNDGKYEVIFGRWGGGTDQLLVLNAEDGTVSMTFPLEPSTAQGHDHPHVIGDVDNDGAVEIILLEPPQTQRKIYSISASGTVEWQATLPAAAGKQSPIIGDFDADGEVEVAEVTDDGRVCFFSGSTGSLERTIASGLTVSASLVAADVNHDGYLEVIVTGVGTGLKAIERNGNLRVWNAPPSQSRIATPAIADLNGDGWPEVVAVDNAVRVFDWSGQIFARAPGSGLANLGNSPVIFDCDADGDLDIVYFMASSTTAVLYKVGTDTLSSQKKWMTYKNDFLRTGIYGSDTYGVNPDLKISNRNWTYGNVSRGSIAYKDFVITNVGKATLQGSCSGQTRISVNDTSFFTLNPGLSKGFRAYFDTSAQGVQTGFLIIGTNDPDEPKLNLTCTANVTQPLHDVAAYAIHIPSQVNPNYVPSVVCEFRNLGAFRETSIASNLTINGILCSPLTSSTFSLNPGQAFNVTFRWDRTNPSLDGEGTFVLVTAAQNANITEEGDKLNNRLTKNVEVKFPILVNSATSWIRVNVTSYSPTDTFTEGDVMNLKVVLTNQYSVPVTILPLVDVVDATGAPLSAYFAAGAEVTLAAGQEYTFWVGWRLGMPISSTTKYNATVYVYDRLGGGVKILALPFVHAFWVQNS